MGLYQLKNTNVNIESGFVEKINSDSIDYERYFESWLENSPSLLLDDEDGSTVLWIGRQVTASIGNTDKFPDLIGIDVSGDLVIIELKKGKTPREVVSQIFEYAAWGSMLDYSTLDDLARQYYNNNSNKAGKSLEELYREVFNLEDEINPDKIFNKAQKLFIVAEEISPSVRQVSEYLRERYKVNINHLEYQVMKTKDGEYFISTEKTLGFDSFNSKAIEGITVPRSGWNGTEKVKDIIFRGVIEHLKESKSIYFMPKDIIKHYPSGQRDSYLSENGMYRLYNHI